jgi:Chlorophyll A-B binding protein
MKTFSAAVLASVAVSASAFAPAQQASSSSSTALQAEMPERLWNTMVDKTQRSKSLPWLPRPANLDGSYVGDQGFDPFYLSSIPKNFAGILQPPSWEATKGIDTLYWMRESELKHCRVAMMAWFGWLATDGVFGFPFRFPGDVYSVENVPNGYYAHDLLVEQGSMRIMLLAVGIVEVCTGAALVQVSSGELTDREAGDFGFDPLKILKGKSKEVSDDMKLKEINNGRLAMLAFGGVATQTALDPSVFSSPPYFHF